MEMIKDDQIKDVVNYWESKMPMLVMEEAGELIQAISKLERSNTIREPYNTMNLIDEIGDMYISLQCLMKYYHISEDLVEKRIESKLLKKYE